MNRKKGFISRYLWTAVILFCLAAVLFSLIYASFHDAEKTPKLMEETAEPSSTAPNVLETPTPTPPPTTRLEETEDMGQEYLDKFYFMGDSTTYGFESYKVIDKNRVWTPSNGTFSLFNQSIITIRYDETGDDLTIEQLFSKKQPEYLLITLGINGVSSMKEDHFKSEYTNLVERIQSASPDTKIILNSMYPHTDYYTAFSMETVNKGNEWVEQVAEATGTRFLNSAMALMDENGYLPHEFTNGDGLHLKPEALELVLSYIRTHGYR